MSSSLDRAVEAHAEAALVFLEDLVRAPSLVGAEQSAMEVFANEAAAVGLEVRRLPFASGPVADDRAGIAPPIAQMTADRYQVVATTPGEGDLLLLLNGHLDVVPAESAHLWTAGPFDPVRKDGKLYGRGSSDMKSGFAIGMLALRALRDVAPNLFATQRLGFVAVVEEECTGNGTLRSVTDHGVLAPEVIVLEPTDLGLLMGGVGVLWADIDIGTPAGHAYDATAHASAFELGLKLIEQLKRWAEELGRQLPEPSMDSNQSPYAFNVGKVHGGDWTSSVASQATFSVRVGFPRAWTPDQAAHELMGIVQDYAAASGFPIPPRVTLTGFRARGHLIEADTPLVRDLVAAHKDAHGTEPVLFSLGSTTDARVYLNDFDTPALCYGAIAHNMHGTDESVDMQSIVDAAKTLARFILMRFGQNESP